MMLRVLVVLILAGLAGLWFLGEPVVKDLPGYSQVANVEKELREMSQAVTNLQSKSQEAGSKSRAEIDKTTQALQTRIQAAQKNLQDLKAAPPSNSIRDRLTRALHKIKGYLVVKKTP